MHEVVVVSKPTQNAMIEQGGRCCGNDSALVKNSAVGEKGGREKDVANYRKIPVAEVGSWRLLEHVQLCRLIDRKSVV